MSLNRIKVSNEYIYLTKSSPTILYPSKLLTFNHTYLIDTLHHSSFSPFSPFSKIPIEILPYICKNLTPKDLAALALVCKQFSEIIYLNNEKSSIWSICQAIWRESRLYVLPQYKKPPLHMSERKYTIMMYGTKWEWESFYENSSILLKNCLTFSKIEKPHIHPQKN
ncbi:unnamed protein product [Rhizophagus irregularis]|uniref:F-box domain-containing protein n=1 Tax=Rhizophagus irregularis TaxID=588596 RepID=A0A915ZBS5_9GLOM|nr:hypothetical protein OCT59_011343 [Rhizophagus irregularis]GBC23793.2 hypothetical protein GLOIN_2v1775399 [Rhizophagus irregularis DAOM 181602=DAOM 197198]CAB4393058.1 unnamed protein product [Rhizophagus irregularis]CAB4413528.1 unnamed protein product [Rhizophagus irregularis]CAB4489687.1 unnamed protein product [Rhizophagus irregularis]